MKSTFSVIYYLKRQVVKKDGTVPVMGRITVDGSQTQFSCKLTVDPKLWDTKGGRVTGRSSAALETNRMLDKMRVRINKHYQEIMERDNFVTAEKVKNAFLGLEHRYHTLMQVFRQHNEDYEKQVEAGMKAKGTLLKYRTVYCTAPQKLDTFGVFFMKYNYEIRLKAVKLVLEGGLSVREAGCHLGCGRSQVHLWVTLFERHGLTGLKLRHGSYSAEFKLSVLKHMHQNHLSLLETAVHFGIPGPFVIRQWERLYQNQGAEGLRRKPQRRRPAMSKSKTKKVKLKTTPHEELLKELEYLRAENAYLKKLQALVEERIVRESGKEPKPSKD